MPNVFKLNVFCKTNKQYKQIDTTAKKLLGNKNAIVQVKIFIIYFLFKLSLKYKFFLLLIRHGTECDAENFMNDTNDAYEFIYYKKRYMSLKILLRLWLVIRRNR